MSYKMSKSEAIHWAQVDKQTAKYKDNMDSQPPVPSNRTPEQHYVFMYCLRYHLEYKDWTYKEVLFEQGHITYQQFKDYQNYEQYKDFNNYDTPNQ